MLEELIIPEMMYDNSSNYFNNDLVNTTCIEDTQLTPAALAVTTATFTMLFCVGVTGNTLVALVIWRQHDMRSSTNYFLLNLSIADMLVLLICVPTGLVETYNPYTGWPLGKFMCYFVPYSENLACSASILTLVAIALERYYVICTPFEAHYICTPRRTLVICLLVWIISGVLNAPLMVTIVYEAECWQDGQLQYLCGPMIDERWEKIYETVTTTIFFFLPFFFLSSIYYVIANTLRKHKTMMANIRDNESESGSVRAKQKEDSFKGKQRSGSLKKREDTKSRNCLMECFLQLNCSLLPYSALARRTQFAGDQVRREDSTQERLTELHIIAEQENPSREDDVMISALRLSREDCGKRIGVQSPPLKRQDTPSSWKQKSLKEKPAHIIYGSKIQRHHTSTSIASSRSSRNSDQRGSTKRNSATTSNAASAISRRSHQRVILMLASVVAIFFVCWAPVRALNLWFVYVSIEEYISVPQKTLLSITVAFRALVYLNAAINPIVYNLISTKFRAAFKSILSCASIHGRRRSMSSRSLSSTSSFRFTKKSVDHAC